MGLCAVTFAKAGGTVQTHGRHPIGSQLHYQVLVPTVKPDTRPDQNDLFAVLRVRGLLERPLVAGNVSDFTEVLVIYKARRSLHADRRAARNDQRGRSPTALPCPDHSGELKAHRLVRAGRGPHPCTNCRQSASISSVVSQTLRGMQTPASPCEVHSLHDSIYWCGCMLLADGIRYDLRGIDGLLSTEPPTAGSHLQKFFCASQWVKQSTPSFTDLVASLHAFTKCLYAHVDRRKKSPLTPVSLANLGWGRTELDDFKACSHALALQVTLVHRDETQSFCVYTDASDKVRCGIVPQVPYADCQKPHVDQPH